jgi:hypothetical protein
VGERDGHEPYHIRRHDTLRLHLSAVVVCDRLQHHAEPDKNKSIVGSTRPDVQHTQAPHHAKARHTTEEQEMQRSQAVGDINSVT